MSSTSSWTSSRRHHKEHLEPAPVFLHQLPLLGCVRITEINLSRVRITFLSRMNIFLRARFVFLSAPNLLLPEVVLLGLVLLPGHQAVHVAVSVVKPVFGVLLTQRPGWGIVCSAVRCGAVRCGSVPCECECSAVQCSAVQCECSAVQCSAVQCSAVQ